MKISPTEWILVAKLSGHRLATISEKFSNQTNIDSHAQEKIFGVKMQLWVIKF